MIRKAVLKKYVRSVLLLCGCLVGVFALFSCRESGENTTVAASERNTAVTDSPVVSGGEDSSSDTVPATEGVSENETDTVAVEETSLSAMDVIERLRESDYAYSFGEADDCGLSDPSSVGICEEALSTVLYPVPADDEVENLVDVSEFGISPEVEDNSALLGTLLTYVADMQGSVKLVFPVGTYRFGSTLDFSGLRDLYICSDRAGTPFSVLMTAWVPGIRLDSADNIQFSDFTLDYETPSAVWGYVVGGNAASRSVDILINESFDLSQPCYNGGKITWGSYMEMYLDEQSGKYCPDDTGNLLYNSTGDGIKNIENGVYNADTHILTLTFRENLTLPKEGTVVSVAYTMYENFGFYATQCENIRLEGVYIYHTTGMALGMTGCRYIYLNRVFLSPREGMLMSATADGLHCMNCTGEITVTGCVFESSHDDCMNINGRYLTVKSFAKHVITLDGLNVPVEAGDVLELYSKEDLHIVGSFTVDRVNEADGTLVVAGDVAGADEECFAANISKSPTLTVRNCLFGSKRNRGILIQTRNATVENCTFRNICHGPIQIFSVPSSFGEGIMPAHVSVKNCKFIRCGATDVNIFSWSATGGTAPGTIQDIQISNNFFSQSFAYAVQISTGGEITVADNLFDRVGTRSASLNPRCAVRVTCSQDVTVKNNWMLPFAKRYTVMNTKEAERNQQNRHITEEGSVLLEQQ